jgi:hypothetical protein
MRVCTCGEKLRRRGRRPTRACFFLFCCDSNNSKSESVIVIVSGCWPIGSVSSVSHINDKNHDNKKRKVPSAVGLESDRLKAKDDAGFLDAKSAPIHQSHKIA